MLEMTGELIGLEVYTPKGIFVGKVAEMGFDLNNKHVDGIIIDDVNPAVAEHNIILNIPFEWISAIGDVILLKRFPEKVLRDGTLQGL